MAKIYDFKALTNKGKEIDFSPTGDTGLYADADGAGHHLSPC